MDPPMMRMTRDCAPREGGGRSRRTARDVSDGGRPRELRELTKTCDASRLAALVSVSVL